METKNIEKAIELNAEIQKYRRKVSRWTDLQEEKLLNPLVLVAGDRFFAVPQCLDKQINDLIENYLESEHARIMREKDELFGELEEERG